MQWWWRTPRATDSMRQLFWFDAQGLPEAAVVATDWGDGVALDVLRMPGAAPQQLAHVVARGLAHARELGFEAVDFVVDRDDAVMRQVLSSHGFESQEASVVETWLAAPARPPVSPLGDGYRLSDRLQADAQAHHMVGRSGADVQARLRQTSLYRPDLDLVIHDAAGRVAAYALFWHDPRTGVGLVEPMRTESEHQRKGLARHLLTTGIARLAEAGARRIKVCFKPDNPAARDLYLGAGFVAGAHTLIFRRPA